MFTIAHLGGIDEIGVFVIPAVLAIWALRRAEKKARARAQDTDKEEHPNS
jgi:hypothetical protein